MDKKSINQIRIWYAGAVIMCVVFAFIYEQYSHGVYSGYMMLAFLFPLAGGILLEIIYRITKKYLSGKHIQCRKSRLYTELISGGVIWLTLGSLYSGVLEIYGTTNRLTIVFWMAGTGLCIAGITVYLIKLKKILRLTRV